MCLADVLLGTQLWDARFSEQVYTCLHGASLMLRGFRSVTRLAHLPVFLTEKPVSAAGP